MAIAASGLLLALFSAVHLAGLALAWWDPPGFERYAAALHHASWLPVVEVALVLPLLLHPAQALARTLANRLARGGGGPPRSRRGEGVEPLAALAGRLMPWSGGLLLLFLLVHLAQLRLRRPANGAELAALQEVLAQPLGFALYAAAGVALALHLFHGQESAFRSLGLLHPRQALAIRWVGRGLAVILGAGFALLPFVLRGGAPA
ncbi:MAG: succinate dehydrogenase [Cyanobacteriota bacterium]|nr:succinate dehydrogenase [Cyanobacteriota bacterium]